MGGGHHEHGAVPVSSAVSVTDHGYNALRERLERMGRTRVRVGVLDDAPKRAAASKTGEKLSLLEVAAVHEFGAPAAGIPQRSFVRATVDEKRAEIAADQERIAAAVLAGKLEPEQGAEMLGARVQGLLQARIAQGIGPALAPATIKRKKSSKPLVDTGQLRSSIAFRVEVG